MTEEQIRQAPALSRPDPTRPEETVSSIARLLGVSRSTIYKYIPELAAPGPENIDAGKNSITA
ncbi:helix-turn-helix domain-containing protein [Nocardia salmonicida]|uniref:helix-turn-helix domain-containing protein n=1 Tax=Nocardia salmonicida TaxID=53431 RepID=UPI003CF483EB